MSRKRGLSRTFATGERQYSVFQAAFNPNRSLGNDRLGLNCGSSRKWSDSTWTHGKQLEQLLQQVTTLRGDIASSRPMLTKGCCKGNNYEQRFARKARMRIQGEAVPFHGTLSRHGITRARFCSWLIEKVVFCCLPCCKIVIHAKRVGCKLL